MAELIGPGRLRPTFGDRVRGRLRWLSNPAVAGAWPVLAMAALGWLLWALVSSLGGR